jgi:twinkle protein
MINCDLLREWERTRAEDLCRRFFPNGKKVGTEWKIADTTGAPGNSLAIQLAGAKPGLWHDWATGEGGDFIELLRANRNLTFPQAVEEIEQALGISLLVDSLPGGRPPQSAGVSQPKRPVIAPWTGLPYHMTPEESRRAYQAARALNRTAEQIDQIADWRGLRPEIIRSLILDCALGIEGPDLVFLFETGMKLRPIGGSSDQSWWAFGKPFVWRGWPLVDASIRHCVSTVHIAEAEFDAARLLELGFESDDLSAIVTAIPGANCFKPEWVTLFRGKKVFLWLDNDRAGKQATKRIGALLFQAGVKVKVVNLTRVKGGA